jgi:hypothetical protein
LFVGQPTVTTVSASSAHVAPGQSVTYQVSVAGPGASTVPTGSVTFAVGSTSLCIATLSGGAGSCSATSAPAGVDAVAGTYSGDSSFGTSLGWTTLLVGVESQSIAFTSSPNQPAYGESYTVTATGGGSGNPVVFTSATKTVCTVSGSTVSLKALGTCTIDANQAGNSLYTAAPEQKQSFSVGKAPTALVAAPEGATSKTMQATLTNSSDGIPINKQLVKFSIGGVTKCSAYTNASGVASCSLVKRPAGTPTYLATFAGTAHYLASSGSAPL